MDDKEFISIKIDVDTYEELKSYCDEQGVRFIDFLYEALDNSVARYELRKEITEIRKQKREIEYEKSKAFQLGFEKGLIVSFLLSQGYFIDNIENISIKESEKNMPYKVVTGKQMDLFGNKG